MYPHVHFELGENRASIHFLRHLIHRRNRQFLPLNCLVGMPHVDAYIHIILVWLRSYHSWADPGCWAWNLLNDVKVKKLVNLCLNFIFQRVRDPPRFLWWWYNFTIDGQLKLATGQRGFQVSFFGTQDSRFESKIGWVWGLKVCLGGGIPKITLRITGLQENFGSGLQHWRTLLVTLDNLPTPENTPLGKAPQYRWYHCLWNKLPLYSPVLVQLSALIAF